MAESLFTSQTPAVVNADNANAIHVGTYFTPAVDGAVTKARWYPPTTSQSGAKAALFRTSDSVKVGADVTFVGSVAGPGWVEVAFASPVAVVAGTQYAVVVRTPRFYSATTGGSSPWPLTNGNLSTPSNAGRFNDADDAAVLMPADAFSNGCYFVDVVFVPDGEEEDNALTAAITLPALQASVALAARVSAVVSVSLPALQGAAALASRSALAATLTLPALDMSAVLSVPVEPVEDTSSPTAPISTVSRQTVIATISREHVITTGSRGGPSA